MKLSKIIVYALLLLTGPFSLKAQDINWRADNKNHIVSTYFGADYSFYYGLSYGYLLDTKFKPLVIGTELTLPFGEDLFDDWRLRTSVQAELWEKSNFSFSLKPAFILRKYESPLAEMYNIGADLSMIVGFIKPNWGITPVINYDRSISTYISHDLLKDDYPQIVDGWYNTSGGNFKFGVKGNVSIKSWNSFITIGKHFGQNFEDNPTFPFFFELTLKRQY